MGILVKLLGAAVILGGGGFAAYSISKKMKTAKAGQQLIVDKQADDNALASALTAVNQLFLNDSPTSNKIKPTTNQLNIDAAQTLVSKISDHNTQKAILSAKVVRSGQLLGMRFTQEGNAAAAAAATAAAAAQKKANDATAAVATAEASKASGDINTAQTLVTALNIPDGTIKPALQQRIDDINTAIATAAVALATAAVVYAENTRFIDNIDDAQMVVSALNVPDRTKKDGLQQRIDTLKTSIATEEAAADAKVILDKVNVILTIFQADGTFHTTNDATFFIKNKSVLSNPPSFEQIKMGLQLSDMAYFNGVATKRMNMQTFINTYAPLYGGKRIMNYNGGFDSPDLSPYTVTQLQEILAHGYWFGLWFDGNSNPVGHNNGYLATSTLGRYLVFPFSLRGGSDSHVVKVTIPPAIKGVDYSYGFDGVGSKSKKSKANSIL